MSANAFEHGHLFARRLTTNGAEGGFVQQKAERDSSPFVTPLAGARVAPKGERPLAFALDDKSRMSADYPKLLGDAAAVAARLKELRSPHVAPLTAFVEELRGEAGPGADVPYFDPWDGGVDATILFLLEAPGPKAVRSGFVSRNNPDETAKTFFELTVEAGLDRREQLSGTQFRGTSAMVRRYGQLLPRTSQTD